jgi:hypothetical protein
VIAEGIDGWWHEAHGGGTGYDHRPVVEDLPGVSPEFVDRPWGCVWRHRWRKQEHINLQEGRALVRAAERVSSSVARTGKRRLILTDSQVVLGVCQKGRSSRPSLNRFARRLA